MVVSMLAAKNMPKKFWAEATMWSFYVLNRCPTKALTNITPQEAWSGIKPTVDHFRVWGCLAHVHVPKEKRTKLDDKSVLCILTGMSEESKAYRLIDPQTMKVIVSKDVIFEEHKSWNWSRPKEADTETEITWGDYDFPNEDYEFVNENSLNQDNEAEHDELIDDSIPVVPNSGPTIPAIGEGRHQRVRRSPAYLRDYLAGDDLDSDNDEVNITDLVYQDPIYFEDAVKDDKWKKAMDLEIQAIERNQTWRLVDLPNGAKCISLKWLFKTKFNERGDVDKYKARLVARGCGQEFGVDYVEIFAPVARMDTIRLMIALAAQKGWNIYQMDVKSAFLHGTLEEDVYVQQPQGYVVKDNEHKVYKLHKALYGLKQAPRAWFSCIEAYFIKEGFTRSNFEHTLFIKTTSDGKMLFVNIYVDDLMYTGNDERMLEDFKCSMKGEFEMTDLGKMRYFLGIEVFQTPAGIHVSQQRYAIEILTRFNMLDCNAVVNPIVPGCKLKQEEGGPVDETLFKKLVGSLMYITTTRPDIQFVVSYISRFMSKPTDVHLAAAKRVIRYLQGTLDYGIWYKRGGSGKMEVFTDSDFAGDQNDRKSTSGYLVLWDGAAITWSSKKQSIVALSSTEAEYVAAAACACQVVWIQGILEELGMKQEDGTVIKCDNTSTIKLSKNPVFHGRCKHIGVRFHFLRDLVGDGIVELQHVGTKEQIADIFTKLLHREVFLKLREKFGICSLEDKQDINV
ncbi:retrovirus-related pol polyprotein from transposon TNT 1-94 [Tanacetum coccineum]